MIAQRISSFIAVAVVAAALATTAAQAAPPDHEDTGAILRVDNHNTSDIVVYAVTEDGKRYRLGDVARLTSRALSLPVELVDTGIEFRVKIYTLEQSSSHNHARQALKAVKTNVLTASAGEEIELFVAAQLEESHIPIG